MLTEMKQKIVDAMQKAKEKGEVTAQQVQDLVKEAVSKTAKSMTAGADTLKEIAREATATSIEQLQKVGMATKERISAAVEGAVEGIKKEEQEAVEATQQELKKVETRLQKGKEELASKVRQTLEGVKEAAGAYSGEVKEHLDAAVSKAKQEYSQLLKVTREPVLTEAERLAKKALEVGIGAVSGMWKGAKEAIKKEEKKD